MKRKNVKPEKIKTVESLAQLISQYPVVGVLNLYKIPTSSLQKIKGGLAGKAIIKTFKKSIIMFALEKSGKGVLKNYVAEYPSLILSKVDPFRLSIVLQKSKSFVQAKTGDIAVNNIVVSAGPTDLLPGPAISTLAKAGIKAKVEAGKINVMKDAIVCKKGDNISFDIASALNLLKIKPVEIVLNMVAAFDNGNVYEKSALFFDEEKLHTDIGLAVQQATNLSINICFPTKQNIVMLISKAVLSAKALESSMKSG